MKKISITLTLIFIMLFTAAIPCHAVSADSTDTDIEYEYYDDGSYAMISTIIEKPGATGIMPMATSKSKTASRTYAYYNKSNKKAWVLTLTAKFSYNGTTAKATSSSVSHTIYVSGWRCSSKSATKSGATAKATGTFKYDTLTKTKSIGLKCSKTGTISAVNY